MISSFITVDHSSPNTVEKLEERAAQIVSYFLSFSTDNDFKDRFYDNHSIPDKESIPAVAEQRFFNTLLFQLRKKRQLTSAQAEAFLCLFPEGKLADWQALILTLALEHRQLFEDKERSLRAMATFRFLLQDKQKRKNLIAVDVIEQNLPNPLLRLNRIEKHLSHLLDTIPSRKDLTDKQKAYVSQRILPLRRLIADVVEEEQKHLRKKSKNSGSLPSKPKPPIKQPHTPHAPIEKDKFITLHEQAQVDEDEVSHALVHEYPSKTNEHMDGDEFLSDNAPDRSYAMLVPESSLPDSFKRSFRLSALRAQKVAGHLERNEKKPVTMNNQLTRYGVTKLIEALRESALYQPDITLLMHLMLTTGRRLEQILEVKVVNHFKAFSEPGDAVVFYKNGVIFWAYRPDLPQHIIPNPLSSLVQQPKNPVILPLPSFPAENVSELFCLPEKRKEGITDFLDDFNRTYKTKLTPNRIADFLSYYLHQHGIDDVVNALITGNPGIQKAGTYYFQYDQETIVKSYELFINEFFPTSSIPEEIHRGLLSIEGGGSQLFVKQEAVSALFAHLSFEINSSKGIAEFHNAYTYYVLHLLNLATGHRPVRDPFDDLNHIDLLNKTIFISDKESRQTASSARVLALPEVAIQQLKLYIAHLKKIQILLSSLGPQLAEEVEMTLAGQNRLLFLLEEKESGGYQIKPLSPSKTQSYLGSLFDIPANWHRHFLRTSLSRQGVLGELIDAWMGHAKIGQEGYSKYSGLSMQGLKNTAEVINQIIEDLNVKPLPGWGGEIGHE